MDATLHLLLSVLLDLLRWVILGIESTTDAQLAGYVLLCSLKWLLWPACQVLVGLVLAAAAAWLWACRRASLLPRAVARSR